ncbi:hypothetical protein WDW37_20590 [Bdellovibrionota bacterium FG-1]
MNSLAKRQIAWGLILLIGFGGVTSLWGATPASAAGVQSELFDLTAQYVFRKTAIGSLMISRMTGMEGEQVSEAAYRSFVQRLNWTQSAELKQELLSRAKALQEEFSKFRVARKRPEALEAGEIPTAEERDFLNQAAAAFQTPRVEDLMRESIVFVDANVGPHAHARQEIELGRVPPRPEIEGKYFSEGGEIDLRQQELSFWMGMGLRARAYQGVFRTWALSDGEWKSLFLRSGKRFTSRDLVSLRRLYRLFDVLNSYTRMRLMVRAFANEPAAVYTYLNDLTIESTQKYLRGLMTVDGYVGARQAAATDLPLNGIVWEAEKSILKALERCYTLGGRVNGIEIEGGQIRLDEAQVLQAKSKIEEFENLMKADGLSKNKKDLADHTAQRDTWKKRLDFTVKDLEVKYTEFVENRGALEIFANLRMGVVDGEAVMPRDMPDPFTVTQEQLNAWGEFYDRALFNSANALVVKEGQLFFSNETDFFRRHTETTRKFIQKMDALTSTVVGKRFTETHLGQEFKNYVGHEVRDAMVQVTKFLGLTLTPAAAAELYNHWMENLAKALFEKPDPSADLNGAVFPAGSAPRPRGAGMGSAVPGASAAPSSSANVPPFGVPSPSEGRIPRGRGGVVVMPTRDTP